MCGFSGFLNRDGQPSDPIVLKRMVDAQRHRGPDDQGFRLFSLRHGQSVPIEPGQPLPSGATFEGAVGFNRLSILDLSEAGHQPMVSDNGRVFITFNGEIYNAFDYRNGLESEGYHFRSRTDTEIILHLYHKFGFPGLLPKLNGMFAICLVDLDKQEMFLARDRLGIKPLYWAVQNNTFLYSSEVKSMLFHPNFRAVVDETMVDEFLAYRYCAEDRFLLKGVHQLPPGHAMQVTRDHQTIYEYWQVPDRQIDRCITFDQAKSKLNDLLETSVSRQLLSDVKVGCQLSGGIDSSLISVFAKMRLGADLDTFSVVFSDKSLSEEPWISQAALTVGADSHRYLLNDDYFLDHMERATWHMDQPFNLPNSIGIYFLAQKSRSLVTVLLSGEGADELFGGYERFFYARVRPQVRPWLPLLQRLPRIGRKFRNAFNEPSMGDEALWFVTHTMFTPPRQLSRLRPDADIEAVRERRLALFRQGNGDRVSNCTKYDMRTYLVDLLIRQDKMTMAHSLENRVPFLDHEVVEFVRTLPSDYLVGGRIKARDIMMRNLKVILKQTALRYFDRNFVYRRKCGFSMPMATYFKNPRFVELMEDRLLPGMRQRGLVRVDVVETLWRHLDSLRPDNYLVADQLWAAVSLELWAQQFVDGLHVAA